MPEHDCDPVITAVAAQLRRPVPVSADLDARIMQAVRAEASAGGLRAAVRWLLEPRAVRVSPLGALASAAGLAGLILLSSHLLDNPSASLTPASAPPALVAAGAGASVEPVQFVVTAPGASHVALVGDFNDWDSAATPLRPVANGEVWAVTVPLAPGRHEYAFVVDGSRWMPDPAAPRSQGADFGQPNSVVTVGSAL